MKRFVDWQRIAGSARCCPNAWKNGSVRAILFGAVDAFAEELDLAELGFERASSRK